MSDAAMTQRPEIYRETLGADQFGIVAKPLTLFETLYNQGWLRKLFVLVVLAALLEGYARWLDNELLVPTFSATVQAMWVGVVSGTLIARALLSIKVLLIGYSAGVLLAIPLPIACTVALKVGTSNSLSSQRA